MKPSPHFRWKILQNDRAIIEMEKCIQQFFSRHSRYIQFMGYEFYPSPTDGQQPMTDRPDMSPIQNTTLDTGIEKKMVSTSFHIDKRKRRSIHPRPLIKKQPAVTVYQGL